MKLNKEKQVIIMVIVVVITMALFAVLIKQSIGNNKMVKQTSQINKPVQNQERNNQVEDNNEKISNILDEEKKKEKQQKEPEIITSDIDASDWQTYKDDKNGFGFKYPKEWKIIYKIATQIQIGNKNNQKCVIINIDKCDLYKNEEDSLAYIVAGAGICDIDIRTLIPLKDEQCASVHVDCPNFDVDENECNNIWKNIEHKKINKFLNGQSAALTSDEIPIQAKNAYNILENIIKYFKVF